MKQTFEERFWSKVLKAGDNECWLWQASFSGKYGQMFISRTPVFKVERAHRIAYRLAKGEIPEGMVVCHSCDNPACCNPAHLWVGTVRENNADAQIKGRASYATRKGEKHPLSKIRDQQRAEAKMLYAGGYSQKKIAELFGVSKSTIQEVISGKSYKYRKK